MKKAEKQQIKSELSRYIDNIGSQNKAAKSLQVSAATISQIMNDNWELIKDEMWRHIRAQINTLSDNWQLAETNDFRLLNGLLLNAKQNSLVFAVIGDAGTGKTATIKHFTSSHRNVYALHCSEFWNRKYFLSELLRKMGRDNGGLTVAEMMQEVVTTLKKQDKPLVILDEADKLPDQVLHFFITLYNELEDHCGLIMIATNYLRKRITRGVKLNRRGYKEIYSRIGRKFIELKGVGYSDVLNICHANGITDIKVIKSIWQNSESDIRRVKQRIVAEKMLNTKQAA